MLQISISSRQIYSKLHFSHIHACHVCTYMHATFIPNYNIQCVLPIHSYKNLIRSKCCKKTFKTYCHSHNTLTFIMIVFFFKLKKTLNVWSPVLNAPVRCLVTALGTNILSFFAQKKTIIMKMRVIEGHETAFNVSQYQFTTEEPLKNPKLTLNYYENGGRKVYSKLHLSHTCMQCMHIHAMHVCMYMHGMYA